MKFVVSTKPLKNVTNLGIIKANISKFYYRSNVVQIAANRDTLTINIEAAGIKSRMILKGSGDEDTAVSTIVDCLVFKNLIDSIDTDVLSLEFIPGGGITVRAGSSKFALPQLLDTKEVQLEEPIDEYTGSEAVTIKPGDWQFIKDHQMYAIAAKEDHPVYKNVWVGKDVGTLVGDYDRGLFTFAKRGNFDTSCLFPPTLINLFSSIPEGSTVSKLGRNYILRISTDSYSMLTEFTPKYEDDEAVGSYNSDIFLGMLVHPESYITVDAGPIAKFINQTSILKQTEADRLIEFTVDKGQLTLAKKVSSCSMAVNTSDTYTIKFATDLFKNVISNFDSDRINIAPMSRIEPAGPDGRPIKRTTGCLFWTDNLTAMLSGENSDV